MTSLPVYSNCCDNSLLKRCRVIPQKSTEPAPVAVLSEVRLHFFVLPRPKLRLLALHDFSTASNHFLLVELAVGGGVTYQKMSIKPLNLVLKTSRQPNVSDSGSAEELQCGRESDKGLVEKRKV